MTTTERSRSAAKTALATVTSAVAVITVNLLSILISYVASSLARARMREGAAIQRHGRRSRTTDVITGIATGRIHPDKRAIDVGYSRRAKEAGPSLTGASWNISGVDGVTPYMERKAPVRVVAVCGSLRRSSSNAMLIAAATRLAPADVEIFSFLALGELPPFNPDLDEGSTPEAIGRFRRMLDACDAVLISSPEYAHGVPGVLKNALDWIVSSGELVGKPVGLINGSPRATHAWMSLVETLTVMSARIIRDASIVVPLQGRTLDADGIAADRELAPLLRSAIEALASAAREGPGLLA